ncbi:hypothetical protein QTP86_024562 [Hemibagrus guttatus]|nr:hypothetical protein QTP86_024562 [Hemibagrus guttatus]
MAMTKELTEDLRLRIVAAHKSGKGYKTISKCFEVPVATVQSIIKKYKTFRTVKNLRGRAGGPGNLITVNGTMKKEQYIKILNNNIRKSAEKLGLGHQWTFQHDNDAKHTAKVVKKWLTDKNINVLQWLSQSPDLNPIENLWRELKIRVMARRPANLKELELIAKDEWAKIPVETCKKLSANLSDLRGCKGPDGKAKGSDATSTTERRRRTTSTAEPQGRATSTAEQQGRATSTAELQRRATSTAEHSHRATSTAEHSHRATSTAEHSHRATSTAEHSHRATSTAEHSHRATSTDERRLRGDDVRLAGVWNSPRGGRVGARGGVSVTSPFNLFIIVIYRLPGPLGDFMEEMDTLLSVFPSDSTPLTVLGDFNFPSDKLQSSGLLDLLFNSCPPTHKGGKVLDLVFTHPSPATDMTATPLHITDHYLVSFTITLPVLPKRNSQHLSLTRRNLHSISPSYVASCTLSSLPDHDSFSSLPMDSATDTFLSSLSSTMDLLCPLSTKCRKTSSPAPWLSDVVCNNQRELRSADRKWKKSQLDTDLISYRMLLSKFSLDMTSAKTSFYKEKLEASAQDPRKLQNIFSSLLNPPAPPAPSSMIAEDFATFYTEKIEKICQTFTSAPTSSTTHSQHSATPSLKHLSTVAAEEVLQIIQSCNPTTCPLDPIPSTMLQTISPDLLPFNTTVINGSLTSGHVPTAIKKARVIPILLLIPQDISNYRPVSLLSFLSKILKHIAAISCRIISMIPTTFDTVNNKTLLSTLRSLGICGIAWEWLASYLDGRSYQLYPHMDFHTTAMSMTPNLSSPSLPQDARISACLVDISSWMMAHQLKLNPSKTELLVIPGDPSPAQDLALSLNNSMISPSATACNLGVTMDNQLSFSSHVANVTRSCWFLLYNIKRIQPFLSTQATQMLVQSLVILRLNYCNSLLAGLPLNALL